MGFPLVLCHEDKIVILSIRNIVEPVINKSVNRKSDIAQGVPVSMKVKELLELLKNENPEAELFVRVDGTILRTDNVDEHTDYNFDGALDQYYILGVE